jgi:hypothetical protein
MSIHIVEETPCPWAAAFLPRWIEAVCEVLWQRLGRHPDGDVHIVLSNHAQHEHRFPERGSEQSVLNNGLSECPEGRLSHLGEDAYAFGIATRANSKQQLPPSVPPGAHVIYLDIETIEGKIAPELSVTPIGMLGAATAHELSHVFRDVAVVHQNATHGWIGEGDAQRDAWDVLNRLLITDEFAVLAREAKAAQIRLSTEQPAAYQRFPVGWEERNLLSGPGPVSEHQTWLVQPSRDMSVLAAAPRDVIGLPLIAASSMPRTGDHLYLTDNHLVAGPWIVLDVSDPPLVEHKKDVSAATSAAKKGKRIVWVHLHRAAEFTGAKETSVNPLSRWAHEAQLLVPAEVDVLRSELSSEGLEAALEDRYRERAELHREQVADLARLRKELPSLPEYAAFDAMEDDPW